MPLPLSPHGMARGYFESVLVEHLFALLRSLDVGFPSIIIILINIVILVVGYHSLYFSYHDYV